MPGEDRYRRIRKTLLDLAGKGVLPDRILVKGLEIAEREPEELSGNSLQYCLLLDRLIRKEVNTAEFLDRWYAIDSSSPMQSGLKPGMRIGRYRIQSLIARGGMGAVWRGVDTNTDEIVAIKAIANDLISNPSFKKRINDEAHRHQRLVHPNIIPLKDVFESAGVTCIVMKMIDGPSLYRKLESRPNKRLEVNAAVPILKGILSALDYAHRQGVIHRDVKPSNVLIDENNQAILIDFGIALAVGEDRHTRTGEIIGTTVYLSPEQINNPKTIDHRSDIYSVGCVFYEMLTGRPPFLGGRDGVADSDFSIMQAHVTKQPIHPKKLISSIPAKLDELVMGALEKDPNKRIPGCREFEKLLNDALQPTEEERRKHATQWRTEEQRRDEKAEEENRKRIEQEAEQWSLEAEAHRRVEEEQERKRADKSPNRLYRYSGGIAVIAIVVAVIVSVMMTAREEISPPPPPPPPSAPAPAPALNALDYFTRGRALQNKGDLDGALIEYGEAIRLKPDYADAYFNRGIARYGKRDFDGAIKDYSEAIRLKPDDALAYMNRGIARRGKRDFDGSIKDYSEAIRLKPDDALPYNNRGIARSDTRDFDDAIKDYSEAIRLKPDYALAYNNRGIARRGKRDFDGAIKDYSEAIRLKPDYALAYNNRGIARRGKRDFDGAIKDYSEAIRLKPDDALAYYNRGNARSDTRDLDGAIEDYSEAIRLKPDYAPAYNNRGNARRGKRDFDGAIKDYTEAIRLKPDDALAYNNRGNARSDTRDFDGAIKDYSEAIRLKPDYALAYSNRSIVLRDKGDLNGAARDEEAARHIKQKK